MASKSRGGNLRAGNRKDRNQKIGTREPELGYYLIVTDTEQTEKNYFEGLRESIPEKYKGRLVIKVEREKTKDLVQRALELCGEASQYRIPCIVFDRDQVKNFDAIIQEAKNKNVMVGWSNPCFEIWLYAYFGEMPNITESTKCCTDFAIKFKDKVGHDYEKNDSKIYDNLKKYGEEQKAIQIANKRYLQHTKDGKTKPSEMISASTVYILVKEILDRIKPLGGASP